jgi:hypothetical protein
MRLDLINLYLSWVGTLLQRRYCHTLQYCNTDLQVCTSCDTVETSLHVSRYAIIVLSWCFIMIISYNLCSKLLNNLYTLHGLDLTTVLNSTAVSYFILRLPG